MVSFGSIANVGPVVRRRLVCFCSSKCSHLRPGAGNRRHVTRALVCRLLSLPTSF